MKDQDKTRSQLLDELAMLRTRVAELERNSSAKIHRQDMWESDAWLRMILDATNVGIWYLDTQTGRTYFSPRFFTMLGYEVNEFSATYDSWRQLIHPDDVKTAEDAIQHSLRRHTPLTAEFRMVGKNKEWHWILCRGNTIQPDTEIQSTQLVGFHTDITERKLAEEALLLTQSIVDRAPIGIWRMGDDGNVLDVNEQGCSSLGYTREELCRMTVFDFDCNMTPEAWKKRIAQLKEPKILASESLHKRKNGEIFPVLVISKIMQFGGQENRVAFVQDISERKQNEAELREKDRLLHDIGTLVKIGAWKFDLETGEATSTDQVARICDFESIEDITIESGLSCYHGENREIIRNAFDKAVKHGIPYDLELEIISAKGIHKWIRTIGYPIRKDGRVVQMQGAIQDLTEKKNTEEEHKKLHQQLIQAQKMEFVGKLAGGVAHDFNNMLSAILGYAEMAMMTMESDNPIFDYLLEIQDAAKRSAELTKQLLAFARKQTVAPRILDLNTTVEGMLKMLHRLIGENINIVWRPGIDLVPVKIDPSQIDQILANLCVNARDAISGVGQIMIETRRVVLDEISCLSLSDCIPGEYVILSVSDTGSGMTKEVVDKIFEPFFTTKAQGKGTGLGLATVYGIISQNQGAIKVYSEPDHGTTFRIYLPVHNEQESLSADPDTTEAIPTGHETILLVEDEVMILKMARLLLEDLGYHVLPAHLPDKALMLAETYNGTIELLLTDVIMPQMNGKELAEKIASHHPDIKCLFSSGYTGDIIDHHGILEDAVHFIQKPYTQMNLAVKIREALNTPDQPFR